MKAAEYLLRLMAERKGLGLEKSRAGGYRLVDLTGTEITDDTEVIVGVGFDMDLEDVEVFLTEGEDAYLYKRIYDRGGLSIPDSIPDESS